MNGLTAQHDFEAADNFPTPEQQNAQKDLDFIQHERRKRILDDPNQDHDPDVIKIRVEKGYTAGTARRIVQDRRRRAARREATLRGEAPPQAMTRPAHPSEIAKAQALLAAAGYSVPLQQYQGQDPNRPAQTREVPPPRGKIEHIEPSDPIETAHPVDQEMSKPAKPAKKK